MLAIGYGHAAEHNTYMTGTWQDIHPLIGIACVRKDLLILFVPGVHVLPIKSHVALNLWPFGRRMGIAPCRIFGHPVTNTDGPICCFPFEWRGGVLFSRFH